MSAMAMLRQSWASRGRSSEPLALRRIVRKCLLISASTDSPKNARQPGGCKFLHIAAAMIFVVRSASHRVTPQAICSAPSERRSTAIRKSPFRAHNNREEPTWTIEA